MENTYVIGWKSESEPRWGQGKKLLTEAEAIALAEELNSDYPAFIHEAINLAPAASAASPSPVAETVSSPIINIDFTTGAEEVSASPQTQQVAVASA